MGSLEQLKFQTFSALRGCDIGNETSDTRPSHCSRAYVEKMGVARLAVGYLRVFLCGNNKVGGIRPQYYWLLVFTEDHILLLSNSS